MKTANSLPATVLAFVCAAFVLSACSTSPDDELVRCSDNPDIHSGCGDRNPADDPKWKESSTVLPPLPQAENLRPIEAPDAKRGYNYFVDRESIVRGSDGVMRYTVVVQSDAGVNNTFHEGLRCLTNEARTYAYASKGSGFRRASALTWKPLAASGVRGYQIYLANVIMCDRSGYDWDANKARKALDSQFTAGGVRIERQCLDLQNCAGYYNRND